MLPPRILSYCAVAIAASSCVFTLRGEPIPITNTQSGISVTLSGSNGTDWAVERTYHDDSLADKVFYVKPSVAFSLAHNERNVITMETPAIPRVVGVAGRDGTPNSGDEGDIYFKIDRDMQSHPYNTLAGPLPLFAVRYSTPVSFDTLTYDGSKKVVGSTGDNGGKWGKSASATTERFAYGQIDAFGNEWHTLTYWDDDVPLLKAAKVNPHRQGASDGHCLFLCVNPKTPVIQFTAQGDEQFYTTPIKTYFIPKIWEQTTYLTPGVQIQFVNLTNKEPVFYRVQNGEWQQYDCKSFAVGKLFKPGDTLVLEAKCGQNGVVLRRQVVCSPDYPGKTEAHGNLLWANETERQAVIKKVHSVEPFKRAYADYRDGFYQKLDYKPDDTRGYWRFGADQASCAMANAFVVAMEGPNAATKELQICKARLLRVARLQPVGLERDINDATPAKDFLNELSQTIQCYSDAAVGYDLMAAFARKTQHPQGMTPIEELFIRESLAKIAKSILQIRDNYSTDNGGGDVHWAHGYEFTIGTIAFAMPTYKTPYYGVSGGDFKTRNDTPDKDGKFWNPFPDQGVTWYEAATDPEIKTPGYPNVVAPFRAEFLLTDDGWWSGPNDLKADGDRYFAGPRGNQLADVKHGGLANADARVELVEMDGYEVPFVARCTAFDYLRRIKGDAKRPLCTTNYIRRRLINGVVPLAWDSKTKTYAAQPADVSTAIYAFNAHFEFASLPTAMNLVKQYLADVTAFKTGALTGEKDKQIQTLCRVLSDARALALCADPASMPPHQPEPNHPPIVKAMFKHVVKPGEPIVKDIIAMDPDGDKLTFKLEGLPKKAVFDSDKRRITWLPEKTDTGVYLVTIQASDGKLTTTRPFPIAVTNNARNVPKEPGSVNAEITKGGGCVALKWAPPSGVNVKYYLIYRDGILWAAASGNVLSYDDTELLAPGENTRYAVSAMDSGGAESIATYANPEILHISSH